MTDDYKVDLLNYVVGNLQPTPSTNDEIFAEQTSIDRSKWTEYLPYDYNNFRFEGMVAGNELTSNLSVLYGGYLDENNNSHGIIILVNENFEPVKTIYNYNSGTELRYIQYMKQAEDGTFYFIDDEAFSYSQRQQVLTSQKRFVMTNNFTLINQITNDYDVVLRKSYIFGNNYRNFYCKNMYKDPNSSHYIFFGSGADSTSSIYDYRLLKIFGLKINVGEANEWTNYASMSSRLFGSAIATFNSNSDIYFRCLTSSTLTSSRTIECISKTYTGSVVTNPIHTFSFQPYIDDNEYKKQSVFLSIDKVYYVQNNQRWGKSGEPNEKYIGLYYYNFDTNVHKTIYEKSLGSYDYCDFGAIFIDKCNTDVYVQFITNVDLINHKGDYYFQRLVNDKWNPILLGNYGYVRNQRTMFIKSNFNLLQIYLFATNPRWGTWFQYLIKENYNTLNYNGEPYNNYNSLIPKQGVIYSNDKLIFARNIYNKTINNNTTVSTVQIPNNYLNNIDLSPKKLLTETNTVAIEDNNTIQKNIYETLFLNYINTINVIDEDTGTQYSNIADYINSNINVGTQENYSDSFIGKVRINYVDGTSQIQPIEWYRLNDENHMTTFSLYTDKVITSIDFISNDETTIYITKNIDTEQGKYYLMSQKIRIGQKVSIDNLQYNNQNIYYNGNQVYTFVKEE